VGAHGTVLFPEKNIQRGVQADEIRPQQQAAEQIQVPQFLSTHPSVITTPLNHHPSLADQKLIPGSERATHPEHQAMV
jgi:hypothetical protein